MSAILDTLSGAFSSYFGSQSTTPSTAGNTPAAPQIGSSPNPGTGNSLLSNQTISNTVNSLLGAGISWLTGAGQTPKPAAASNVNLVTSTSTTSSSSSLLKIVGIGVGALLLVVVLFKFVFKKKK